MISFVKLTKYALKWA